MRLRLAVSRPAIVWGAAIGVLVLSVFVGIYVAIPRRAMAERPEPKLPLSGIALPTGQIITPTAASGAMFQNLNPGHDRAPLQRARQADALAVSPDGRTLAILTGEFNGVYGRDGKAIPELSTESIFLFDVSGYQPKPLQVLSLPNAFQGLSWAPSSDRLFASGGTDDAVLEFVRNGPAFEKGRTFRLGHHAALGISHAFHDPLWGDFDGSPVAAGLAVSPDGARLLVANMQNDSVSLINLQSGRVVAEQDLRPGIIDTKHRGEPGGSYPRCVAWISPSRAYVGSLRDREIIALAISEAKIQVVGRTPVHGQPLALLANRRGSRLYAALDNTDQVAVFDTARNIVIEEFNVVAPEPVFNNAKKLGGANSNALALTPAEDTLLVSNGGENAVAVVRLSEQARGGALRSSKSSDRDDEEEITNRGRSEVVGLVPTGWYPTGVATSRDGATWYVINGKSETGSNSNWCHKTDPATGLCVVSRPGLDSAANGFNTLVVEGQFNFQLERAGFLTLPAPSGLELARLTKQVALNDHFAQPESAARDQRLFSFLREHIKHVIYIIKENRTYDQILGDLKGANGDPRFTIFPEKLSPNHHAIARGFVTLDNFLVSGEGSWTGWDWSTAARINDFREHQEGGSGFDGDEWGANRSISMAYGTSAERHALLPISPIDPDILPGTGDVTALDGPGGEAGKGYIWDAAMRKGLRVRNYGFYELPYSTTPLVRDPFAQKTRVYFPSVASLAPNSDPYYRGWDPAYPDYWRYREWKREFDGFVESKTVPALMLVQLGNDHLGSFDRAIDGVNTPETQMADNDYALALILESVANSPFARDTLIIAIEDDTCDGPDHVDAFRSVALLAGPYVRQHAVVSTRYTTVNVVKTIEEILGIGPVGLNDALAIPMSDVFDPGTSTWSYQTVVPDVLRTTKLPLPRSERASNEVPKHLAAYWVRAMAGQDFSRVDRADPATFNRALWTGLKGKVPYPLTPIRADLSENEVYDCFDRVDLGPAPTSP